MDQNDQESVWGGQVTKLSNTNSTIVTNMKSSLVTNTTSFNHYVVTDVIFLWYIWMVMFITINRLIHDYILLILCFWLHLSTYFTAFLLLSSNSFEQKTVWSRENGCLIHISLKNAFWYGGDLYKFANKKNSDSF